MSLWGYVLVYGDADLERVSRRLAPVAELRRRDDGYFESETGYVVTPAEPNEGHETTVHVGEGFEEAEIKANTQRVFDLLRSFGDAHLEATIEGDEPFATFEPAIDDEDDEQTPEERAQHEADMHGLATRAAKLRGLLADARANGAASVADAVYELVPSIKSSVDRYAFLVIRRATENEEDMHTFYDHGGVVYAVRAKHPDWIYGINDEGAADDLLADEEYDEQQQRETAK